MSSRNNAHDIPNLACLLSLSVDFKLSRHPLSGRGFYCLANRAVKGGLMLAQRFSLTLVLRILEFLFDECWLYVLVTTWSIFENLEYAVENTQGGLKTSQQTFVFIFSL